MAFNLAAELQQKKADGVYRQRRSLVPGEMQAQSARVQLDGRELVNFCSNDYLGLARHPEVIAAFQAAAEKYGVGSGASHLVCGHSAEHQALEEELAEFTGRERVLLFSTGYQANTGTLQALLGRTDAVFEDKLNHASLIDGGLASGAKFQRYRHGDVAHLRTLLEKSTAQKKIIVSDGVFSMDGDIAPLPELVELAQQHDAWLMVDDAHGFGVLGQHGGGVAEQFALSSAQLPVLMGTLGKSFGTFGAFVAGDAVLVDYLINNARPYIFTTALPPAVAAASRASLKLLRNATASREKLSAHIHYFKREAQALGLEVLPGITPIQPVLLGSNARAQAWSAALEAKGFLVGAIRPPTVAVGTARLRITFSAAHEQSDVDGLLRALADCRGL